MSFADWLDESRRRYHEEPPARATLASVREFCRGARTRLDWLVASSLGGPGVTTRLAGERVHFVADSQQDLRRARSALNEEPALEWLLDPVDETTVVWDIGAFHGTYAVVAAVRGASVVAFEPEDDNRSRLERNAALNAAAIDTRPVALSDTAGRRAFGDSDAPGSELRIHDGGEQSVETDRGDAHGPAPDVVKIDVEGHECAVLDGMPDTLERVERVLVEVHAGVGDARVRQRLAAAGLTVIEIATPRSQTYLGGVRR